jgi:surface protein
MIPQMDDVRAKMESLRQAIDAYKISVSKIIDKLQKVTNNIEEYYNINNNIIENYENNYRNYEILNNVNGINDDIKNTLYKICNNLDIMSQTKDVFDLYNKMTFKSLDEIIITYDLEQRDRKLEGEETVNIFGQEFVAKNKDKCRMIINNQSYELQEKFNIKDYDQNQLKVKINGLSSLNNLSYMFSNCTSLISVPDIANINTIDITDMRGIFDGCSALTSLPDISKWNLINATSISRMFDGCCSLTSLPDISKWDISNVKNISYMFDKCSSLINLPEISKWDTKNVTNMKSLFCGYSKLTNMPNINTWNISNVKNISYMFYKCSSLIN